MTFFFGGRTGWRGRKWVESVHGTIKKVPQNDIILAAFACFTYIHRYSAQAHRKKNVKYHTRDDVVNIDIVTQG